MEMSSVEIDAVEQPWLGAKYRCGWRGLFITGEITLISFCIHSTYRWERPWEKSSPILINVLIH